MSFGLPFECDMIETGVRYREAKGYYRHREARGRM